MKKIYCRDLTTPVGQVVLGAIGDRLCLCDWKNSKRRMQNAHRIKCQLKAELFDVALWKDNPKSLVDARTLKDSVAVLDETERELADYFAGNRKSFDVPLLMVGTDFQKSVWRALQEIPYDEVVSYMDIAMQIGNPKAVRAVSQAIGSNPLSILIPCHRVVGSNGSLTGFAGGLDAKRWLLDLEKGHEK